MCSIRFISLALLSGVVALPASATTPVVDPLSALIREYSREGSSAEYIRSGSDASYARYVLGRPDFPYAEVVQSPLPPPDAPTRRAISSFSTPEHPVNQRDLHAFKVWDLGFTKSRLGREIPHVPAELRTMPGVTGVVKAGVEPDIYIQAIHIMGPEYPAIAANYAVAAQILRHKLASTPRRHWEERGLRADVLDRFVHAAGGYALQDYDLHYLIQLLDGAMSAWDVGQLSAYGLRELPVSFRVSRLAAAYRDRRPYDHEPCRANGTYDPRHAGVGGTDRRPLCFVDATDRAVHAWYTTTLRGELSAARPVPRGGMSVAERMTVPLKASGQGWIGIRRPGSMAFVSRKEVVEAKVAGQLHAEGGLSYRDAFETSRRALRLTCGRES